MNKRTFQLISIIFIVVVGVMGIITYQKYTNYKSSKNEYATAKQAFDTGNRKYAEKKKSYDKTKNEYLATKEEVSKLRSNAESETSKVDKIIETYTANIHSTIKLLPTLRDKLSKMDAPEGIVFKTDPMGKPFIVHTNPTVEQAKKEWSDYWLEAEYYAEALKKESDDNFKLERVKTLIAIGRPFKDNEWPEGIESPDGMMYREIGTGGYDGDMKTNFAGLTSDAEYAEAQDDKVKNQAPSKEESLKFVKEHDKNNPDLAYNDFGVNSDSKGQFRLVKVSSKEWQEQGGTGSLGFLKVYGDGTVEDGTAEDMPEQ